MIKSPVKFSIVTNATLLSDEKIKYLAENNVEVGISIDGPKILMIKIEYIDHHQRVFMMR